MAREGAGEFGKSGFCRFVYIAKKFCAQTDQQTKSIPMTSLPLRVKQPLKAVPESDWKDLRTEAAGIKYAIQKTQRQDKSICADSLIDQATLSRAKAGQVRLSEEDIDALMDATGSEAPLYAFLLRRGYDPRSLRKLETELERLLREKDEALDAERVKVRVLTDALQGRTP